MHFLFNLFDVNLNLNVLPLRIDPFLWIITCATIIVLTLILTYHCQDTNQKPVHSNEDNKGEDKISHLYEKNLIEGAKLSLDIATENEDNKNEAIKGENDKTLVEKTPAFISISFSFFFFFSLIQLK